MKKPLQIILTALLILIGAIYLYVNRSQLAVLRQIQIHDFCILFAVILAFFYISGYTFKLIVGLLNVELSVSETIGLSILTNFGNYLAPVRPGAALKAVYLKASKGLPYAKFTSVLAVNTFLAFFMTGLAGLILILLLIKENVQIPIILPFVCLFLIIGSVIAFACKMPNIKARGRITQLLQSGISGFQAINVQKRKLFWICLTFVAQFLWCALINEAVFRSLGIPIGLLSALVIGVFAAIANFFTQEAVIAYLLSITGFDFTTGVIGAGLSRVIHMIITFSLAPLFVHTLFKSEDLKLTGILLKTTKTKDSKPDAI